MNSADYVFRILRWLLASVSACRGYEYRQYYTTILEAEPKQNSFFLVDDRISVIHKKILLVSSPFVVLLPVRK
jgi:hypothetical protein